MYPSVAVASHPSEALASHLLSPLTIRSMLLKSLHLSCGDRKTKIVRMGDTGILLDSEKTSGRLTNQCKGLLLGKGPHLI